MRRVVVLPWLLAPLVSACGLTLDLQAPELAAGLDAGRVDAGRRDAGRGDEDACAAAVETCDGRDDDCDGAVDEGFDLRVDPSHCGACGRVCPRAGGAASCQGGVCQLVCDPGRADCDGEADNGCEADLSEPRSCGECTHTCSAGWTCEDGTCVAPCPAGQISCGGECVDLLADERHCGGCGRGCFADPHGDIRCEGGRCVVDSCGDWHEDCNDDASDGCETDILTASDCGACGAPCAPPAVCLGGACATP